MLALHWSRGLPGICDLAIIMLALLTMQTAALQTVIGAATCRQLNVMVTVTSTEYFEGTFLGMLPRGTGVSDEEGEYAYLSKFFKPSDLTATITYTFAYPITGSAEDLTLVVSRIVLPHTVAHLIQSGVESVCAWARM